MAAGDATAKERIEGANYRLASLRRAMIRQLLCFWLGEERSGSLRADRETETERQRDRETERQRDRETQRLLMLV